MGEAGRRRALEQFLQERCTDRTELLYEAHWLPEPAVQAVPGT